MQGAARRPKYRSRCVANGRRTTKCDGPGLSATLIVITYQADWISEALIYINLYIPPCRLYKNLGRVLYIYYSFPYLNGQTGKSLPAK